jgi:hypothetical protein
MMFGRVLDEEAADTVDIQVSARRNSKVSLIVSKNLDVMKNKAQFASKGGSVVFYVTKRVAGWNAVLRAC